jgi:hypothetical protein
MGEPTLLNTPQQVVRRTTNNSENAFHDLLDFIDIPVSSISEYPKMDLHLTENVSVVVASFKRLHFSRMRW